MILEWIIITIYNYLGSVLCPKWSGKFAESIRSLGWGKGKAIICFSHVFSDKISTIFPKALQESDGFIDSIQNLKPVFLSYQLCNLGYFCLNIWIQIR